MPKRRAADGRRAVGQRSKIASHDEQRRKHAARSARAERTDQIAALITSNNIQLAGTMSPRSIGATLLSPTPTAGGSMSRRGQLRRTPALATTSEGSLACGRGPRSHRPTVSVRAARGRATRYQEPEPNAIPESRYSTVKRKERQTNRYRSIPTGIAAATTGISFVASIRTIGAQPPA